MLGMEPKQIARVVRQQEALFSSVYEGLIAVDPRDISPRLTAMRENVGAAVAGASVAGQADSGSRQSGRLFTCQIAERRQDVMANFNGLSVIANREAIRSGESCWALLLVFAARMKSRR